MKINMSKNNLESKMETVKVGTNTLTVIKQLWHSVIVSHIPLVSSDFKTITLYFGFLICFKRMTGTNLSPVF